MAGGQGLKLHVSGNQGLNVHVSGNQGLKLHRVTVTSIRGSGFEITCTRSQVLKLHVGGGGRV